MSSGQLGENFDVHPWRPAPPAAELLQSLQEMDRKSAQHKSQFNVLCFLRREINEEEKI